MELTRTETLNACFFPVFHTLDDCRLRPETYIFGSETELGRMLDAMKTYYKVTSAEWDTLEDAWHTATRS